MRVQRLLVTQKPSRLRGERAPRYHPDWRSLRLPAGTSPTHSSLTRATRRQLPTIPHWRGSQASSACVALPLDTGYRAFTWSFPIRC